MHQLTYVSNDPRELDVDHQVPRVQKLFHLFARQTIHARHLDVDVFVSDSDGLPNLRRGESVKKVQNPPCSPSALPLNRTQSRVSRSRPMHAQAESYSCSNAAVAVCRPDAA